MIMARIEALTRTARIGSKTNEEKAENDNNNNNSSSSSNNNNNNAIR